jgi:hypothetical protein
MITPQELRQYLPQNFNIHNRYYKLTYVEDHDDKFAIDYVGFTERTMYLYKNDIREQINQKQYCIDTITRYIHGR